MDQNWELSQPLRDGSPGLSCPRGSEDANGETPGPPGTEHLRSPPEHPLAPGSHLSETARKRSLPAAKLGHSPPSTPRPLGRQEAAESSPRPCLTSACCPFPQWEAENLASQEPDLQKNKRTSLCANDCQIICSEGVSAVTCLSLQGLVQEETEAGLARNETHEEQAVREQGAPWGFTLQCPQNICDCTSRYR